MRIVKEEVLLCVCVYSHVWCVRLLCCAAQHD